MNAEDHKYFSVTQKKITFSEKTCRDIIDYNLHSLLYFAGHLPRIANLLTRFVVSCKMTGEFTEKTIDNKYIFQASNTVMTGVSKCRDVRNEQNWMKECKHICENFTMLNFPSFFIPNLETFKNFNEFFTENLRKMDSEA